MEGTRSREAAALVGRTFGEFVVREPLSSGGFGMVFRAEQPALAREAVIKVLHTRLLASETVVQRFLREARLASRLDHPYAAHTYAFGAEPDGVLWIAMELVRGTPLDRMLIVQGPIPLERFVPLLERICEVVHTAHEQGIVHRDLKPGNVMVLARAGRLLPKLLDFGIAKLDDVETPAIDVEPPPAPPTHDTAGALDETVDHSAEVFAETAESTGPPTTLRPTPTPTPRPPRAMTTGSDAATTGRLTHVGATMGSPLYMAPEQWSDAAAVGPPTDLYALGILCFEALTGTLPFKGETHMQIAMAHARQPVPPLGAGFPRSLDRVMARVLAKNPRDRYASALEFAAAFRTASGVASDPVILPRLEERARDAAIARAHQPLARAVAALDAARNAHQARDALWQVVRVAVRLLGVSALAAHSHVRQDVSTTDPMLGEGLRRLRGRALGDRAWLELARELVGSFENLRDAHPIPELVDFLTTPAADPLDELLRLRAGADEAGGGTDERVRELLESALPLVAILLDRISFLSDYQLAVPDGDGAETWVGAQRDARPRRALARRDLPAGRPVLLDATGAPVVTLWPFVQVQVPAPGEPPSLFFFEGRGRRGARLVALPDPFELESEELWEAVGGMLDETSEKEAETVREEVCPFPGLAPYGEADAASFLGRERESEAFLNRLRVTPLLAVVGPSGAGKSSFVQAGVLPDLPEGWQAVTVRPGPAPLVSLLVRLGSLGAAELPATSGVRDYSPNALGSALRAAAAAKKTTFVVVVDQLEELFTLCDDAGERERYAETLVRFARTPDDPVRVILTLRDDFLLRAEALPGFRARLGQALQLLTTPAEADLKRILVEPLRRAGYEFDDPGLPDEMIEAVNATPAALALLSFTASKLWELRDRRFHQIGHRAYRSLGGVGGALAQHAESTLQAMRPEEQRLVREVFRHLVTAEGTRAVLSRAELDEILGSGGAGVIEKLVGARLLVISETESGGERVEVTHEALLDAWPRLVSWRREDAEGARLRDQLRAAARQWEERGRPNGLLWRGDALAEYRQWRARHPGGLTAGEEAFTSASLADAARSRRLRRTLLAVVIFSLVAVAVVLFIQNTRVERQRARAIENERSAQVSSTKLHDLLLSQYESQGRRLVLADDPLQGMAYLYKAAELGAHGKAHDFLVAQAVRATDGELMSFEHHGIVGRVRFSPDGSRIATASYDGNAAIWDSRRGTRIAELAHPGGVIRVEWGPDGRLVATAGRDNLVAVWDAATGKQLYRFAQTSAPQAIGFSRDGSRLAVGTILDAVELYDLASGQVAAELRAPQVQESLAIGQAVRISPDGALVAAGDFKGVVRVWHVATGRPIATLTGPAARITTVDFSRDGRLVAAASLDSTASVWQVESGRRLHTLVTGGAVNSVAFSPDGSRLVTASNDRRAVVWDAATGKEIASLAGHAAAVYQAAWSPDGSQIVTASDDGTAALWDVQSGRRLARLFGHRGPLRDVAFDPGGRRFVTASVDGSAILWSAEPAQPVTVLRSPADPGDIYSIAFAAGGAHVLTASLSGVARVWDATTGTELMSIPEAGSLAALSPDEERIASNPGDVVAIWNARSGARIATLKGHEGRILSVEWDRTGKRLLSLGADGSVRVWSVDREEILHSIRPAGGPIGSAGFSPSGTAIVTLGADGMSRVFDATTGEERSAVSVGGEMGSSTFDHTGTRMASPTQERAVKIWRLDSGKTEVELIGHLGNVFQVAWSPDDELVATASIDGTARIWSSRSGDLLAVLDHQQRWVDSIAFSPDGRRIATGRADGLGTIWEVPRFQGGLAGLEKIVRCRVPYDIRDERVIQRRPDRGACAPVHDAR